MGKVAPSRRVACELLGEVRRRDARGRDVLRGSSRMDRLDERDRGQVTRLVLGVIGARGFLDGRIDARLRGPAKLEPKVRDALRLAVFELLFCATPAAVVVSQGVELVRGVRPRAAALANAVLRRVADEDVSVRTAALAGMTGARNDRVGCANGSEDRVSCSAWVSGYPEWLLDRLGEARDEVALSATEAAPVYVVANLALHDDEQTCALLEEAGLAPRPTDLPGSFVLGAPAGLVASGLVESCDVAVADLSAQRVARQAGVRPGMRVLEVGQGRGTKSLLLQSAALRAGGSASIVGIDSVAYKPKVAARRMERSGLASDVACLHFDACQLASDQLPAELSEPFDLVFVDAPCSGTGTMRRHPEIVWGLSPADVSALAGLQIQILRSAATRVRPGGTLCYATCSLLREENEDVVEAFLASRAGRIFGREGQPFASVPRLDGPDGHFCQRLKRQ